MNTFVSTVYNVQYLFLYYCRLSQVQSSVAHIGDLALMLRCWKFSTRCPRPHVCMEFISTRPESHFELRVLSCLVNPGQWWIMG